MFVVDEQNPLKSVREVSYFLFAMLKNLPPAELNKLTDQRLNKRFRKTLMWNLHMLNCGCDRAERQVPVTDEDVLKNRALDPKRKLRGPRRDITKEQI